MKKHEYLVLIVILISAVFFQNCQKDSKNKDEIMQIEKTVFGQLSGKEVDLFTLKNSNGVEVEILEFGAIVKSIKVPDKNKNVEDIVLGYDNLDGYANDPYYFGATIGRVANRIGGAKVVINNKSYELAHNTYPDFGYNHLHGGIKGFNKVFWKGEEFQNPDEVGVILKYLSKDKEEGYPGNLNCIVVYSLNNNNELKIVYKAETDEVTLVNMTHHSYFNLAGAGNGTVLNQIVSINANQYTKADEDLIPTGEILPVKGTAVDFLKGRSIGSRIDEMKTKKFQGYDLNYVIIHSKPGALDLAATARDKENGRTLEVFSTQPCMHFYTANFLEGKTGKEGKFYNKYGAFCFEPQGYPNAPNHKNFDSILLKPGEKYEQTIIYKFSVDE